VIAPPPSRAIILRRFLRTPKGLLTFGFVPIVLVAIAQTGPGQALPGLIVILTTACILDIAAFRLMQEKWVFPSGAILTGLILAMVLAPTEPAYVEVAAASVAILSKHAMRTMFSNVFNPAAVALVAVPLMFGSAESWWGALPDLGVPGVILLVVIGGFIADRINKLPLVLAFLGVYFALFAAASFVLDPGRVAEIFRTPDLEAVLFFALFLVDDPPTCPARYRNQLQFAAIAAVTTYILFITRGAIYYLPAGLLVANGWESARRVMSRRSRVQSTARPLQAAR
jgi:Na+-translocating ferredoxin:NAD+ oxidoreductase RnfD subunit